MRLSPGRLAGLRLESEDFSRGLLERRPERCVALPMGDLEWDDWGRPERIIGSLIRIGRKPSFPVHLCRDLPAAIVHPAFSNPRLAASARRW